MEPAQIVAFDIETEPNEDLDLSFLPEPPVDQRLKDPEKIEARKKANIDAQLEKLALDPHFGRVISISFAQPGATTKEIILDHMVRKDADFGGEDDAGVEERNNAERSLLMQCSTFLATAQQVISFWGAGFDVPFLLRRAMMLRVPFKRIECGKYRCNKTSAKHMDVALVLNEHGSNPLNLPQTLEFYAETILGVDHPAELKDKLAYSVWFREGLLDKLKAANNWDAEQTLKLGLLVKGYYL